MLATRPVRSLVSEPNSQVALRVPQLIAMAARGCWDQGTPEGFASTLHCTPDLLSGIPIQFVLPLSRGQNTGS